ncbi:alpha/beta hydrolase [Alkalihalobacterium sp. APHAB7]|uniref:alpha/beta hydrolase n=1 Tax=Alkalihalobacterium sp. APHAB7 TaxID=3402081 RepID=UPI003AAA7EE9
MVQTKKISINRNGTKLKSRKGIILKIILGFLVFSVIITFIINTVIAYNILSSMSDGRVEFNEATLEDFHLVGEQIEVFSSDGLKINAYIVPHENSSGTVLILHGMHGMDATSLFGYAQFLFEAGYTPVAVDMRAHGKSEGERLSFGYHEVNDVNAVVNYLKTDDRFKGAPMILYGLSMGASTAINVAAKNDDIDAVIADSPYLSMQRQVADYMKRDGASSFFVKLFEPSVNLVFWHLFRINPVDNIPEKSITQLNHIPIFIIHGDADTQTAVYHASTLYERSSSDMTELWIVEGKDHLIIEDVLDDESLFYRERIIGFLNGIGK